MVDLERAAVRVRVPLPAPATSVAVSPDGRRAFAGAGSAVSTFALDDGPAARVAPGGAARQAPALPVGPQPAAPAPGGAAPGDGAVAVRTSPDLGGPVRALAVSPAGGTVFVAAGSRLVLLDARDLHVVRRVALGAEALGLARSRDGSLLALPLRGGRVAFVTAAGRLVRRVRVPGAAGAAFDAAGRAWVSGSKRRLWVVANGKREKRPLKLGAGAGVALAASPDGGLLAVGAARGGRSAALVDTRARRARGLRSGTGPSAPGWSSDGVRVYLADAGGAGLSLVSPFTRTRIGTLALPGSTPVAVAIQGGRARTLGTDGADAIGGSRLPDLIEGLGGDDRLNGGRENDELRGGAGNDVLVGGTYDDRLDGGDGRRPAARGRRQRPHRGRGRRRHRRRGHGERQHPRLGRRRRHGRRRRGRPHLRRGRERQDPREVLRERPAPLRGSRRRPHRGRPGLGPHQGRRRRRRAPGPDRHGEHHGRGRRGRHRGRRRARPPLRQQRLGRRAGRLRERHRRGRGRSRPARRRLGGRRARRRPGRRPDHRRPGARRRLRRRRGRHDPRGRRQRATRSTAGRARTRSTSRPTRRSATGSSTARPSRRSRRRPRRTRTRARSSPARTGRTSCAAPRGRTRSSARTTRDQLFGLGGDDYVDGENGNDELHGGPGNDTMAGRSGDDRIYGDDGDDRITGDRGRDRIAGGRGNDTLFGNLAPDVILGGPGDDRINVVRGEVDEVQCGPGRDVVFADPVDRVAARLRGRRGASRPRSAGGGRASPRPCASSRRPAGPSSPSSGGSRGGSAGRAARPRAGRAGARSASSRLRTCERASWATARTTGPSFARTRAFCSGLSAVDAPTSKLTSMREAVTFACWPPGPEERDARTWTSASGTATPGVMRIGSSMAGGP